MGRRNAVRTWATVAVGAAMGLGIFTFMYAEGYSYMLDDPKACVNCHVMRDQYDAWQGSSHHAVATCNDCHTPHNLFGKYRVKATNGMRHSAYFTLGNFPEPIRINDTDRAIAEENCRRCHQKLVNAVDGAHAQKLTCTNCHWRAGHQD
jgi:cytochrome c nitrite reductase small subunit